MFTEEPVKQYENIGFRPIGLYANHIPAIKWGADNGVYNDPTFRWSTSDKVTVDRKLGTPNIATMLGRTSLKDSETEEYLNLNVLDTDSVTVSNRLRVPIRTILDNSSYDWVTDRLRDLLQTFLNKREVANGNLEETLLDVLKKSGYVTKTRKEYGYHFYWLDLKQNPPIGTADCLPGKEFELKTNDKYGLCTLPDSSHRGDPNFKYKAVGRTDTNLVSNVLYDLFVEMFKDCLVNGKLDDNDSVNATDTSTDTKTSNKNHNSNSNTKNRTVNIKNPVVLSDSAIMVAAGQMSQFVARGYRNDFYVKLSGMLFHLRISEESGAKIIARMCAITNDEELKSRQITFAATYEKGFQGQEIEGGPKLAELIAAKVEGIDLSTATTVLDNLKYIWQSNKDKRKVKNGVNDKEDKKDEDDPRTHAFEFTADISDLLMEYKYALKRYGPLVFIIIDNNGRRLLEARIKHNTVLDDPKNPEGERHKEAYLSFGTIYLNAIPIEVILYEDPINITLGQRYKIKFRTHSGKYFTTSETKSLDSIINDLSDKSLVCSRNGVKDALSLIINAFENDGSLIISREIETSGFYLVDRRIKAYHVDRAGAGYTQQDILQACVFLNELVTKFRRIEVPATTIKWGIVAPFDYTLKQYTDDLCWIPWMGLSGFPRSGKTTQGRIAVEMWRHLYPKGMNPILPYTAVSTEARFAGRLNRCTPPIVINECDALSEERNVGILAMAKNSMETKISRAKYENRRTWIEEPALSACILTSNPPFSSELGFRSRLIYIVYTKEDKYWNDAQQKEFMAFFTKGSKLLKVLGTFSMEYILNNQQVLLKQNIEDCDWKVTSEQVLSEFYKAAGLEVPNWVSLWVNESDITESAIEEANTTARFEVRAFFENTIIDKYRIDPLMETDSDGNRMFQAINVDIDRKLDRCLKQRLITYLHSHTNRNDISEIVITHDVLREIKRFKIANIGTLQALAREIPNFTYGLLKLGGKNERVVHGPYEDFVKFLNIGFEEND